MTIPVYKYDVVKLLEISHKHISKQRSNVILLQKQTATKSADLNETLKKMHLFKDLMW